MPGFPNTARIDHIHLSGMEKEVFCPIGETWYTYRIDITMIPNQTIPDYLEIRECIDEQCPTESTLEDFAAAVRDKMAEMYEPLSVEVSVFRDDAKHMSVGVKTKYCDYRSACNGIANTAPIVLY